MISRRDCLKAGAAGSAVLGLAGCKSLLDRSLLPVTSTIPAEKLRFLNRIGFGPSAQQLAEFDKLGQRGYLEAQLNPATGPTDDLELVSRLRHLEAFELDSVELSDQPEHEVIRQLGEAAILSATYSRWQLRERLVDFWSNHFNLYARKSYTAYRMGTDQVGVIRKHALGRFRDLLGASAKSPAMLIYLDNQKNQRGVANENYARELMELHTLGVHGGYTQKDVQEVARCLTGWTVEDRILRPRGRFRFDEESHDGGSKSVLGHEIAGNRGIEDGELVLDILASHPSTAKFISQKLCRYFVGTPSDALVEKAAQVFLESDGNIAEVTRKILASEEVQSGHPIMKRPFDYVVSALRISGADTNGGGGIQGHLDQMGQPLFQWPMPDGYPDKTSAWTGSMLARWNFAFDLEAGTISGVEISPEARTGLAASLAHPDFQWR